MQLFDTSAKLSAKYPEHYAIAVKDGADLFQMFVINRSRNGDIYVNFNQRDPAHRPHSSYHASGQIHHKSHAIKVLPAKHVQSPGKQFSGSQSIITTSISKGDARAWNVSCAPGDYIDLMIIDDGVLPSAPYGYQFDVEVVASGARSWISTYPYAKVIQEHTFKAGTPWIVSSLYEMRVEETQT